MHAFYRAPQVVNPPSELEQLLHRNAHTGAGVGPSGAGVVRRAGRIFDVCNKDVLALVRSSLHAAHLVTRNRVPAVNVIERWQNFLNILYSAWYTIFIRPHPSGILPNISDGSYSL